MAEAGQKVDAILQAEFGDAAAQGGGVIGLGLGADQNEVSGGAGGSGLDASEGVDELELVFLGIDAADVEDEKSVLRQAMKLAEARAIPLGEAGGVHAIGQVGDAVVREAGAGGVVFALADADDEVGVFEQGARAEQSAKGAAPLEAASDGLGQGVELCGRDIEDTAVEGDDEGLAAEAGGGGDGAAEALQGVGVEEADIGLAQKGGEERDGEQVTAFFVQRRDVRGGEAQEGVEVAVAFDGDTVEDLAGAVSEGHGGDDFRGVTGGGLLAGDFGDDGFGAAPFVGDEAAGDMENGR